MSSNLLVCLKKLHLIYAQVLADYNLLIYDYILRASNSTYLFVVLGRKHGWESFYCVSYLFLLCLRSHFDFLGLRHFDLHCHYLVHYCVPELLIVYPEAILIFLVVSTAA